MNILKQFSFFTLLALLGLSSTYATTSDVESEEEHEDHIVIRLKARNVDEEAENKKTTPSSWDMIHYHVGKAFINTIDDSVKSLTKNEIWAILQEINSNPITIKANVATFSVKKPINIVRSGQENPCTLEAGEYEISDEYDYLLLPDGSYGYNNVVSSKMHQYPLTTLLATLFIGLCSGGALGLYTFNAKHKVEHQDIPIDEIDIDEL